MDSCFFKTFQGRGFPPKEGKQIAEELKALLALTENASANVSEEGASEGLTALFTLVKFLENKRSQKYFHDTGATPRLLLMFNLTISHQ
jgi:hypothetical protein